MKGFSLSLSLLFLAGCASSEFGDPLDHTPDQEGYYYQLVTLPIPDDVILEVGGLDVMDDGRPVVATRRGEVWIVNDAYSSNPSYKRFAAGLHEPLGLLAHNDALYTAQRGELTKLMDENGDERADIYQTIHAWELTGNYHEYSYGPLLLPNGNFFVSLNLAWLGRGVSTTKWRGWALEISEEGEVMPMAVGFRSPAGIGITAGGDVFYGENQGDWIGSGWISHIERGDFLGHPDGLKWSGEPNSPISLAMEDVPNTREPMHVAAASIPEMKLPTVWFPHTIMGISTSAIIEDATEGGFGPFAGQLFVGDQGHSKLMRVFLEKIDGAYQGATFPFYEGFASGILRTEWGEDHSLFVGQTSRGWAATGKAPYALERLRWTGKVPFEMKEIRAQSNGFELTFTSPVAAGAADESLYEIAGFTYKYHSDYGSEPINTITHTVSNATVSEDGLRVTLEVEGLRAGYIHEIKLGDVPSAEGTPLLHDVAYYTLNAIPSAAMAAGQEENAQQTSATSAATSKRITEMPSDWAGMPIVEETLATLPNLLFDSPGFEAEAGARVALTLHNNDDMLHNLVIVAPGEADRIAEEAMNLGIQGQSMQFVPEDDAVLYYTNLLQPETEETIYFTAPSVPGDYTIVCTFPGHGMTMRATLTVTEPA